MTRRRIIGLIAAKDLRIERHSRVVANQILPFAGVTMVMFGFAIDSSDVLERVAPGLVWLATLFSLLVLVQRAFAIETDDGALDALRVAGVDPTAIFWGKVLALAVQLAVLEVILLGAALVLYGAEVQVGGVCVAGHDAGGRDLRTGRRRYAVRRPCRWVQGPRDTAPAARVPGGGARPDRSDASGRISARHRWGGSVGGLALGGPARRLRRRLRGRGFAGLWPARR